MDELVAAQQSLGKSLGKARAGEDKELAQRVREHGEAMAQMLAGLLKMSHMHSPENHAFDVPVNEFLKALTALDELVGTVHLVTVDEHAYLNDMRLRAEGKAGIRDLGAELRKHNVGGLSFHAPLDSRQVRALVAGLSAPPVEPLPRTALRERLAAADLRTIELHGIFRFRTSDERPGAKPLGDASAPEVRSSDSGLRRAPTGAMKAVARQSAPGGGRAGGTGGAVGITGGGVAGRADHSDAVAPQAGDVASDAADAAWTGSAAAAGAVLPAPAAVSVEPPSGSGVLDRLATLAMGAWDALATGRHFSPLPLRRAVAEVLELGVDSPQLWDAWALGPTRQHHSVTVLLHALLLGQAAGIPRAVLQDLGVAALVHDIGYAALVGKPIGAGVEGLKRHPGEGVRLLLQQRGFSQAKVRRLRAILEHHRPQGAPDRPSVLGAILHLVDDYVTFLRVYGSQTTAVHVVGAMAQDGSGANYHPVLLPLFVNTLGQFPPGVLLERADGSRVRSVSPVRSPETFMAPLVRPVDAAGQPLGPIMELAGGPPVTKAWPG